MDNDTLKQQSRFFFVTMSDSPFAFATNEILDDLAISLYQNHLLLLKLLDDNFEGRLANLHPGSDSAINWENA